MILQSRYSAHCTLTVYTVYSLQCWVASVERVEVYGICIYILPNCVLQSAFRCIYIIPLKHMSHHLPCSNSKCILHGCNNTLLVIYMINMNVIYISNEDLLFQSSCGIINPTLIEVKTPRGSGIHKKNEEFKNSRTFRKG